MHHSNVCIANALEACVGTTCRQRLVTLQAGGEVRSLNPADLTADATWFRKATILALKALDGTVNVGNVYLGCSSAAGEQPYLLAPSDQITLEPPTGARFRLADWYFTGINVGDGLVIIFA